MSIAKIPINTKIHKPLQILPEVIFLAIDLSCFLAKSTSSYISPNVTSTSSNFFPSSSNCSSVASPTFFVSSIIFFDLSVLS